MNILCVILLGVGIVLLIVSLFGVIFGNGYLCDCPVLFALGIVGTSIGGLSLVSSLVILASLLV